MFDDKYSVFGVLFYSFAITQQIQQGAVLSQVRSHAFGQQPLIWYKRLRNRSDSFKLFDACCSCLPQVLVAYLLLCTGSISWLEPWPKQSKSSYHSRMNLDFYYEITECAFLSIFSVTLPKHCSTPPLQIKIILLATWLSWMSVEAMICCLSHPPTPILSL